MLIIIHVAIQVSLYSEVFDSSWEYPQINPNHPFFWIFHGFSIINPPAIGVQALKPPVIALDPRGGPVPQQGLGASPCPNGTSGSPRLGNLSDW